MTLHRVLAGDLMARRSGSVDPSKFPDEVFELHSIPAFDLGKPEIISGSEIGSTKQIVQPNDVMISKIVPHIRRASVVGPASDFRQIASGEWIVFRSDRIHPPYLRHVLISDDFNASFMRTVSGVGGSLLRARPAEVAKIEIPLPPLPEQRRIAAILDKADALRAKRREAIAKLDQLLQSVFLDMFGDPVTNPKGWPCEKFGELCRDSFRNGLSPSSSGSVPGEVLTLTAITGPYFDFAYRKHALFDRPPSPDQMLSPDTFLICRGNGNKKLVGAGAFADRLSGEVSFPDTMIGATIDESVIGAKYLETVWRSRRVREQIESGARTTNGTFKVNQSVLGDVRVPLPPVDEQMKFGAFAEALSARKKSMAAHSTSLDALFASTQQSSFAGA